MRTVSKQINLLQTGQLSNIVWPSITNTGILLSILRISKEILSQKRIVFKIKTVGDGQGFKDKQQSF